jgi:hypothetical protein
VIAERLATGKCTSFRRCREPVPDRKRFVTADRDMKVVRCGAIAYSG